MIALGWNEKQSKACGCFGSGHGWAKAPQYIIHSVIARAVPREFASNLCILVLRGTTVLPKIVGIT